MTHSRRKFLQVAAGVAALPAALRFASAQTYPTQPVRLIVPFPAGGQIDIVARLIGQWLSEKMGQQFFVDNRPGAGGNVGTETALRAEPDGHTLLLASATNTVNATLFDKLNFDFIRDTAAIATINRIPLVLQIHPTFPATSVAEFIAYAKANPGKVNLATPTKGTGPYMAAALFKIMTGIDVVLVPYRGDAPMLTDMLGSQVLAGFGGISASIEHIRAGRLRALAIGTPVRLESLPDVPTVRETVTGYEASGWCGIVAPKKTPAAVIDRLNKEINAALADANFKSQLTNLIAPVFVSTPAEFGKQDLN